MAKQNEAKEYKGGLERGMAIQQAVNTLIPSLKARHGRKAAQAGWDFVGGAQEGIVLAWKSWDAARGPWLAHARVYAEEYALREVTKSSSVVSTNYSRRKLRYEQDEQGRDMKDMLEKYNVQSFDPDVVFTKDGTPDRRAEVVMPDEACASQEALATIHARISEVLATIDPNSTLGKLAPEIVASWLDDNGDNAGAIGVRNGFSRLTGYRNAETLREALREMLAEVE